MNPTHTANDDPTRPRYHFSPPTGWMNDQNGTIFQAGYYHVFYQFNPYGDTWGTIHWGHARSRDLIHWEHLPIALKPDPESGEEHCFSGCLVARPDEPPVILYTAVGPHMPVKDGAQQWAAIGDPELITWRKHTRNPVLTDHIHGDQKIVDWRDPFVFCSGERTFMLLGGKQAPESGGAGVVLLYETETNLLDGWRYRGVFFRHPDPNLTAAECPNFFRLGNKWVLLISPFGPVEYYLGTFDEISATFEVEDRGQLDGGDHFYATNIIHDSQQQVICFGWVRGFATGRGWNGCLSLPRILSLDANGCLQQRPAPELERLRGVATTNGNIVLGRYAVPDLSGDGLEVYAHIERDSTSDGRCGLSLQPKDALAAPIVLSCMTDHITLNDKAMAFQANDSNLHIRLFLDRTVIEVFVNNQVCLTLVRPPIPSAYTVEVFAEAQPALLRELTIWSLQDPRQG